MVLFSRKYIKNGIYFTMASLEQIRKYIAQNKVVLNSDASDEQTMSEYTRLLSSGNPHIFQDSFSGLKTIFILTDVEPDYLVLGYHGFGSNGADMAEIGAAMADVFPNKKVLYAFPDGPVAIGSDSRAWFPRHTHVLLAKYKTNKYADIISYPFDHINETRSIMLQYIGRNLLRFNIPSSRISLFGFSQGGMMTADTSILLPEAPLVAAEFSGIPINTDKWDEVLRSRSADHFSQTHFHINHGRQDAIIQFEASELMLQKFSTLGAAGITENYFNGPHTMDRQGIETLQHLISKHLDSDVLHKDVNEIFVTENFLNGNGGNIGSQLGAIITGWKALKALLKTSCDAAPKF